MVVFFRVDSSHDIGTGHVMRCLTLASTLRERGVKCRFICRTHEVNLIERILQDDFEVSQLQTIKLYGIEKDTDKHSLAHEDWLSTDWQSDAGQTIAALGNARPDWMIVDHYALDVRWESALRPYCDKIMVIDDLADRDHDCDLLLDQNLVAEMFQRYDKHIPDHCGLLLGPKYALLQSLYAKMHPRTPPRIGSIQSILVYFGGIDAYNLTGRTITAFIALKRIDIKLDVVLNPDSSHFSTVSEQVRGYANITLHVVLPSLAPLMVRADLAIGAGGATSWERCCLGLPSLIITLAENQKALAAELHNQALIRWLGHQDKVSELMLKIALHEMIEGKLISDWSYRCMALVDGKGADLVSSILLLNSDTKLKARHVELEDEGLLLRWANDRLVRKNAFHTDEIDPNTHRDWFYRCLKNIEHCHIYIIETEDEIPIGQVRFELSDNGWEIDYALDPIARNRKIGMNLLQAAMHAVLLIARVKKNNFPSKKIFECMGFAPEERGESIVFQRLL